MRKPEEPGFGRLAEAVDLVDVGLRAEFGGDASVEGDELVIDDCGKGEGVEKRREQLENLLVVFREALFAEVEGRRHLPALVVAPQEEDRALKSDLQRHDYDHHLDGKHSAVDEVSQEKVSRAFRVSAHLKQLNQVVELSVDVPDNGDRVVQLKQVALAF